jgi:hypothetical protein
MELSPLLCHRCGRLLHPGEGSFYIVNIEAYADPSPPALDEISLAQARREYREAVRDAADQSEQELMDQVYRKLRLELCTPCYRRWIEKPAG